MRYEYKVVPAPTKGLKAKGVKTTGDRFAHALQSAMNDLGADGWEYQRTDTLPCEEREGLMGKTTVFQNMLVFRRVLQPQVDVPESDADADRVADALAHGHPAALIEDRRHDDPEAAARASRALHEAVAETDAARNAASGDDRSVAAE